MKEIKDEANVLKEKSICLANLIKSTKVVVVHTGAGVSTSAGIPDFRGPKGVWTLEEQGKTPHFNTTFDEAFPTFTHRCLAAMEKQGLIDFIISQNVDGLHLRSGFPRNRLAELHGNMFTRKCMKCHKEFVLDSVTPTMGLKATGEKCPSDKKRGCCRGMLRDTILDWEDGLPDDQLDMAEKFCKLTGLSITVGTSLQILPAANLPVLTKKNGGKLAIINLQPTKHDKKADMLLHGYCDEVFKQIAQELNVDVPKLEAPVTDICMTSVRKLPPEITDPPKKRRKSNATSAADEKKKPVTNNKKRKVKEEAENIPITTSVVNSDVVKEEKNSLLDCKTIKKEDSQSTLIETEADDSAVKSDTTNSSCER